MADKFPEIDVDTNDHEFDGDFMSREKELVGDEFQTENDAEILAASDDDQEIQDFKEQFPDVGESDAPAAEAEDDEFEGFESTAAGPELGESEPLKEWQQRRELEIEEREKVNGRKKENITKAAEQSIDDFYDNYNNKKEESAKQVLKEEQKFLDKRDDFLKRGTLWDRVNELVKEAGAAPSGDRDSSRFKGLLTKLKGKENVPGATGYTK